MTALSVADWCHLSYCWSRFPWAFIEEKCLTSRGKNLFVLKKFKNSLCTNLSQCSTLMLNRPQMPDKKTTFLPIDKFYLIWTIQRMTLPCDSTWPHIYHDIMSLFPTFSTHSSCNLHACFSYFTMMLYDFLAISIWNVFVKWIIIWNVFVKWLIITEGFRE